MSRWIDASLPISNESLVWPGDEPIRIRPTCQMSQEQMCNESRLEMGSHVTTHIDAPYHFDPNGQRIDEIDPATFIGTAWVLEATNAVVIGVEEVQRIPNGELHRVILKTRNTGFLGVPPFRKDYVGLTPEAARYLVSHGCKLVGIDYYSICPYSDLVTTHRTLLGNGVVIVEALVLKEIEPGPVEIAALPLRITGGDASPARVLIRPRKSA